MKLGQRITEYRKAKRYSVTELAEKIGTTRPHFHSIETGATHPRICTVVKIAEVLDVSIDILTDHRRADRYMTEVGLDPDTSEEDINMLVVEMWDVALKSLNNQHYDLCITAATDGITLHTTDKAMIAELYSIRARAWAACGEYRDAIADMTVAIANNPKIPINYLRRCHIYIQCGDRPNALADRKEYENRLGLCYVGE